MQPWPDQVLTERSRSIWPSVLANQTKAINPTVRTKDRKSVPACWATGSRQGPRLRWR
jgi:hypothetical protein